MPEVTRRPLIDGLALFGASGFAFSQPILSVFGENPTTFREHGLDNVALVAYVALLALGPPLVLVGVWLIARRVHEQGARFLLQALMGLLGAFVAMQALKSVGFGSGAVRVALALVVAAAIGVGYGRFAGLRQWLGFTAPLPVAAVVLFCVASPSAALIAESSYAFEPSSGGSYPNVIVLVLDELPTLSVLGANGSLDAQRYPNLAAFAADATWYPGFTTVAPHTDVAVPATLSGNFPAGDPPLAANYPNNLFTAFAPTHELAVFERVTELCDFPACEETALGSGAGRRDVRGLTRQIASVWLDRIHPTREPQIAFDEFEEEFSQGQTSSNANAVFGQETSLAKPRRFLSFLDNLEAHESRPSLYYMHLVFPHYPFRFWPDGTDYTPLVAPGVPYAGRTNNQPWIAALDHTRHLLQVQYVDALFGQFLERLHDADLYDDSLVVVVSDHGASFRPGSAYRSADAETLQSVAFVPLLIKEPGQAVGNIDPANVSSVDVLPSIADLAGVALEFDTDGDAIGSEAVANRGDGKLIWDKHRPPQGSKIDGPPREFSMAEEQPAIVDRLVWLPGEDGPLDSLHRLANVSDLVGRPFEPGDSLPSVSAQVPALALFQNGRGDPPTGVLQGTVLGFDGDLADASMVLSLDGQVVGGSQIFTLRDVDDVFAVLLPQEFLGRASEVRIGLRVDGQLREIAVP